MFTLLKKIVDRPLGRWRATSRLRPGRAAGPLQRRFRPTLDALEDRIVPSATILPHNSATVAAVGVSSAAVAPVVTGATASGPTSGSLSSIQVTFSQPIVPSTFTPADLSLLGPSGRVTITSVTAVQGKNDETFALAFAKQTAPGTYTLYVGSDAKNSAGTSVTNYHTAFKIAPATTATAPHVTSVQASGPSGSLSSIRVTFSQPIVPSTFTPADLSLQGPNGKVTITSVTAVQGTNNESFTLAFAKQTTAGTWTLNVGSTARNQAGTHVTSSTTTFKVTPAVPSVTNVVASGSNNSLSSIRVTFSQPIVPSTLFQDIGLQGPSGPIAITSVNPASGTDETFNIFFAKQTAVGSYRLSIGPAATNQAGIPVSSYNATFKIAPPPPQVTNVQASTASGSLSSIQVTFNQLILPSTFTPADVSLQGPNGAIGVVSVTPLSGTNDQSFNITFAKQTTPGNYTLLLGSLATNSAGTHAASFQATVTLSAAAPTPPLSTSNFTGNMVPGQLITSSNGQYALTLQSDGNLVEYNAAGTAVWSSGTSGKTITQMSMQSDGNLVLYDGATPVWSTNTSGNPGASLTIQNNGAVVISRGAVPIWGSTGSQPFVLVPGQLITSPNGEFALVLQGDGNLVEYNAAGSALWSSGTGGQNVTEMVMQSDGNLVLYSGATQVWASNTSGNSEAYLNLQNNGAFVIDTGTTPIWTANVALQPGGILVPGESLPSPNGQYTLTLQGDGNLVEYNAAGAAVWATGTNGQAVTQLVMQSDGNLVLYNGTTPVWSSNTSGNSGAYLSVQNSGNVVIDTATATVWTA